MTEAVDVCNLALNSLGLEPVSALSDQNQRARTCDRFYENVRDSYLSSHDWNFALKVAELTAISAIPDGCERYSYGYEYPSDCLNTRALIDGTTSLEYAFVIMDRTVAGPAEEKIILTDLDDAYLKYTAALEDPDLFDASFLNALSKKIAFEIALPLTKDRKIQAAAFDAFSLADAYARQKDSSEQLPEAPAPLWEHARRGFPFNPAEQPRYW